MDIGDYRHVWRRRESGNKIAGISGKVGTGMDREEAEKERKVREGIVWVEMCMCTSQPKTLYFCLSLENRNSGHLICGLKFGSRFHSLSLYMFPLVTLFQTTGGET